MYLIKGKFVDRDCFCVMKDINFFFNIYGLESILSINFIYSLLKKNTREKGLQQQINKVDNDKDEIGLFQKGKEKENEKRKSLKQRRLKNEKIGLCF